MNRIRLKIDRIHAAWQVFWIRFYYGHPAEAAIVFGAIGAVLFVILFMACLTIDEWIKKAVAP